MDERRSRRIAAADVRSEILAAVRAAGPEYAMLAAFATIAANLIDFASLPAPGEPAGGGLVAAMAVRILAAFFASYAIDRRMAGVAGPLRPGLPFLRFFLFTLVFSIVFGLVSGSAGRLVVARDLPLANQWLVLFAVSAFWGVATVRLLGWQAALAVGAPFRALPGVFRGLKGAGVPLALAFVQLILPFAAIHLALTLLGMRLPLSGPAFAALALIDGLVSAVQLVLGSALAVTAWRLGTGGIGALRGRPARR